MTNKTCEKIKIPKNQDIWLLLGRVKANHTVAVKIKFAFSFRFYIYIYIYKLICEFKRNEFDPSWKNSICASNNLLFQKWLK
jgi:hypothetical protein